MSEKTFKIVGNDISDGYHTFTELYEHRCLLFLNLCLCAPGKARWKKDYEAWFCLYLETQNGQISYHLPDKFISYIDGLIKRDDNYQWDGHSSADVLKRLDACADWAKPCTAPVRTEKPRPLSWQEKLEFQQLIDQEE
jgi:hypothetical protein